MATAAACIITAGACTERQDRSASAEDSSPSPQQAGDTAEITIDYLGQEPPGTAPRIFAPGIVTTEFHDDGPPAFSPDGTELFFRIVWHRDEEPVGTIFHMRLEDGEWTEPRVAPFSGEHMDGGVVFSPDGDIILFGSNRPVDDRGEPSEKMNLWVVERTESGWSRPRLLDDTVNAVNTDGGYSIAANGTLYLGVASTEGEDDYDINRSRLVDGRYTKLESLGAPINTEQSESAPAIAPDESYLVFSAIGDAGLGIFVTFRTPGGSWSDPVSLGERVNEGGSLFPGLSPDGKYLFFVGHRVTEETNPPKQWKTDLFETPRVTWGGDVYWVGTEVLEALRPDWADS